MSPAQRLLASIAVVSGIELPAPTLHVDNTIARYGQVFRAGADAVAVDFTATDSSGRMVDDLRVSELTLLVDGRSRAIESLQLVRLESAVRAQPAASTTTESRTTQETIVASELAEGRDIFLIFDQGSIRQGQEQSVKAGAIKFVETLTTRDRVALLTTPPVRVNIPLGLPGDSLKSTLDSLTGHESAPPEFPGQVVSRNCEDVGHAQRTVEFISGLLATSAETRRIIVVVLMSGGLPPARPSEPCNQVQRRDLAIDPAIYEELTRAATRGRARLFIIQPHSFLLGAGISARNPTVRVWLEEDASMKLSGLEALAGATGGSLFRLSGNAENAFSRIGYETEGYYLLGFRATSSELDGRRHKIGLRTSRRNVTVRSRDSFRVVRDKLPISSTSSVPR